MVTPHGAFKCVSSDHCDASTEATGGKQPSMNPADVLLPQGLEALR